MTISTTTSKVGYNGNGVTTAFSVPFLFLANADLTVVLLSSAGVETTLTLSTHYTVTGAGNDSGGTLTMVTPPAVGERLTILREVALTQETDYISGDPFPAETHERALDRLTMIDQQQKEVLSRAMRLPVSDTASAELPAVAARASKYLAFDASGNPVAVAGTSSSIVVTPFMEGLLDDADATTARTTLGLASTTTDNAIPRFDGTAGATQNSVVTIGDTGNVAGVVDFSMTGKWTQAETSARSWGIGTRSAVTTYPVPSLRPSTTNTTIAVDVMPNGTPAESSGNGYAWVDVCSADVLENNNPVYGARLAATSVLARVASFNYNGASAKVLAFGIGSADKWYIDASGFQFAPAVDNTYPIGSSGSRCSVIYAGTGTINTSDRREKQDFQPISDAILDAWSEVEFCTFRWKSAVEQKGPSARKHVGLIAQDIQEAFERHGLDAFEFGLLCYDEWTHSRQINEDGGMAEMVESPGNRYGIRAEQCLFLEAALMRREVNRLKTRNRK